MGLTNKTDTLDARGLAILLRNGTLPELHQAVNAASHSLMSAK